MAPTRSVVPSGLRTFLSRGLGTLYGVLGAAYSIPDMPRYVVLRHEMPRSSDRSLHWDLMLECNGTLRTWALSREPQAGATVAARQLPNHRLHYLDYEGPISGDRGVVERWDSGDYRLLQETADGFQIQLEGRVLLGDAWLAPQSPNSDCWVVTFSP